MPQNTRRTLKHLTERLCCRYTLLSYGHRHFLYTTVGVSFTLAQHTRRTRSAANGTALQICCQRPLLLHELMLVMCVLTPRENSWFFQFHNVVLLHTRRTRSIQRNVSVLGAFSYCTNRYFLFTTVGGSFTLPRHTRRTRSTSSGTLYRCAASPPFLLFIACIDICNMCSYSSCK